MSRAEALPSSQSLASTAYSRSPPGKRNWLFIVTGLEYDVRRRTVKQSSNRSPAERSRPFMRIVPFSLRYIPCAISAAGSAGGTSVFHDKDGLQPIGAIQMPGIEGRIDHMAATLDGSQLFVAGLASDTVLKIDTRQMRVVGSIRGIREPQSLRYIPSSNRLALSQAGAMAM